jgi:hypothetical protein
MRARVIAIEVQSATLLPLQRTGRYQLRDRQQIAELENVGP